MNDTTPVFVADSCIGGLSLVKSLWTSRTAGDAIFLADYAINPLGLKSNSSIADVVDSWLRLAAKQSDTLVIACNTLSIRYHQLGGSKVMYSGLKRVVSMVDCFEAMVKGEADRLANSKVLVIGTAFTANQGLYSDILKAALPDVRTDSIAATELERKIARFESCGGEGGLSLNADLKGAIENTDIAVLACTCFPMAKGTLEALFPDVVFLDPGTYCSNLLKEGVTAQDRKLTVKVTGDVVSERRVSEFAESYLGDGRIVS